MNATRTHHRTGRHLKATSLGVALGLAIGTPVQADVDISNVPLFLNASVDPNILYIIDDSGSMNLSFVPDICDEWNTRRAKSSHYNTIYYDPAVTYLPPLDHEGNSLPNSTFTSAWTNGYSQTGSVNLSSSYRPTWSGSSTGCTNGSGTNDAYSSSTSEAAYYYVFDDTNNNCNGTDTDEDCYDKVVVSSTSGPNASDERTNFANWYSYYRTRLMVAKAGSSRAFATLGTWPRVGYGKINQGSNTVDGQSTTTIQRGVRTFDGTDRENFFDWLFGMNTQIYTPLRRALDAAGQYFTRTDARGPYNTSPGSLGGDNLSCRQNYTILMTDGYWNDAQAATTAARSNNDGTNGPTITGPNSQSYTYSATSPFTDNRSNTLADVAMYYWKNDLTNLTNNVPTTPENPAFWQHMVTFGVGLGVPTSIDPDAAFDAIESGDSITWPDPVVSYTGTSNLPAGRADELLHAAVNSRGGFFNAQNPTDFATELGEILNSIVARVESSSTSAAASSATLQTDTLLYTAGFRSTDWSGQLLAREILRANDGGLYLGDIEWNAEEVLVDQADSGTRNIFTSARSAISASTQILTGSGVALNGTLHANQVDALNRDADNDVDHPLDVDNLGDERIEWLYGDDAAHASFRTRQVMNNQGQTVTRLLGDIINSNPQFAGKRDFGYRRLSDLGASYLAYRTSSAYQNRPNVLYVAANDGMLHGFDALDGEEHFAYMPSELLLPESGATHARINQLMTEDYTDDHRFFMDGTVTVADAHWGGTWKSVLVGTMGAGGRTVFALDVSNPASFGTSNILWEFTDPDLGYGVGKPIIVRMNTGDWAAVFGNGYNSANHKAVLYIVRLSDGNLLAKINTNSNADTAASPNGLAAPNAALTLSTLSATTIYAGDLKGRLWRFDVTGNQNSWDNNNSRGVLFQARDSANIPQPITSAPEIALNPSDKDTIMVMFGTGSYFRTQDSGNNQVQSLYGIIDDGGAAVSGRNQLTGQSITWQGPFTVNGQSYTLREVSDNSLGNNDGWYLDLIYNNVAAGERVISKPVLLTGAVRDRVRFTTMIPDPDPCGTRGGRTGFIMDIMIDSGGRAATPVFDLNNDGNFNAADIPGDCEGSCSGLDFGGGEELIVIQDGDDKAQLCSGEGDCVSSSEPGTPTGRQSWRQLR